MRCENIELYKTEGGGCLFYLTYYTNKTSEMYAVPLWYKSRTACKYFKLWVKERVLYKDN